MLSPPMGQGRDALARATQLPLEMVQMAPVAGLDGTLSASNRVHLDESRQWSSPWEPRRLVAAATARGGCADRGSPATAAATLDRQGGDALWVVGPGRGSRVTRPVEAAARCGVAASPDGHGVGRGAQGPDPSSRARLFCLVSSLLGTHFSDLEKRIPVQETPQPAIAHSHIPSQAISWLSSVCENRHAASLCTEHLLAEPYMGLHFSLLHEESSAYVS